MNDQADGLQFRRYRGPRTSHELEMPLWLQIALGGFIALAANTFLQYGIEKHEESKAVKDMQKGINDMERQLGLPRTEWRESY